MTRRKRRRRALPEHVGYLVEVSRWDWSFSFGISHDKRQADPYSEYRHLAIHGNLLRPVRIKAKEAELIFLPKIENNEASRMHHEPRAVGSLNLHGGVIHGVLSMPADALPPMLTVLTAHRFRFVVLHGEPLRWSKALIRSYSVDTPLDEEDYPVT